MVGGRAPRGLLSRREEGCRRGKDGGGRRGEQGGGGRWRKQRVVVELDATGVLDGSGRGGVASGEEVNGRLRCHRARRRCRVGRGEGSRHDTTR
jgi:hypothetical protein